VNQEILNQEILRNCVPPDLYFPYSDRTDEEHTTLAALEKKDI
jgi:hypothetical protein